MDSSETSQASDWVFPSFRCKGKQPRTANMLVENHLRPAAVAAGVLKDGEKVRFGFHNLRHSLCLLPGAKQHRSKDRADVA